MSGRALAFTTRKIMIGLGTNVRNTDSDKQRDRLSCKRLVWRDDIAERIGIIVDMWLRGGDVE
jgi:hypothetical protein